MILLRSVTAIFALTFWAGLVRVGRGRIGARRTIPARAAIPFRTRSPICPFGARIAARARGPGEGVKDLQGFFGLCFGGLDNLGRIGNLCVHGGFRHGHLWLGLGPFTARGSIAQPLHQVGELFQRRTRDREHVRRPFEPGAAILGAQQVCQTFQHIDANRAGTGGAISRHRVMSDWDCRQIRDGHQPGRRAFGEFVQPVKQRTQHQTQPCGRGFQKRGQEHGILPETHTMLAQQAAGFLIQRLDVVADGFARDDAHRFDQLERNTARHAGQGFVARHGQKGIEQRSDLAVDEVLQAAAHLVHDIGARLVIDKGRHLRAHGGITLDQFADRGVAPHQPALFGEIELGIGAVIELVGFQMQQWHQCRDRGLAQCARLIRGGGGVGTEAKALQTPDQLTLDSHFALVVYFSHKALLLFQPPQQNRGAPVDKSLCQSVMQGIRQAVFYSARRAAPMVFIIYPAPALRDIGPGPDIGQTARQGVDITICAIDPCDIAGNPFRRDLARTVQEFKYPAQKPRMLCARDAAEIGDSADIPKQRQVARIAQTVDDIGLGDQRFQRQHVIRVPRARQPVIVGLRFQRRHQPRGRAEIQPGIAPGQFAHGQEFVVFDGGDHFIGQGPGLARDAESAVGLVAPCAACDLGHFVGVQGAHAAAIELGRGRKRDMLDIQVQPHADGISRHQVIHIAILIQSHLRIARARRQRAHDHRTAPFLAADQFGNRIDIFYTEAHDSAARGHAAYLFRTCIRKLRHAFTALELHARHQRGNRRAHGIGPHEQRFMQAARMQKPVGKDMAAISISAKLDFVDGDKIGTDFQRHRFHSAHPVLGAVRDDTLLARDQCHTIGSAQRLDAVIDLARQQAQGQADDAGAVGQHALDGVMCLAGIRGAKHSDAARA